MNASSAHTVRMPALMPGRAGESLRRRLARRFARLNVFGLLWAVAVVAIELPTVLYASRSAEGVANIARDFAVMSICFSAAFTWAAHRRLAGLRLALLVAAASVVGSALAVGLHGIVLQIPGQHYQQDSVVGRSPLFGVLIWLTWLGLVYGGFAAVVFSLRRGIDQTTHALANATIARERNEAAIAEAKIQAMVERIEPSFLLDVMASARDYYRVDVPRAESIINECVEFLRTAMPQIRSGHSTLEAELDVAAVFLTLRNLTIDGCPAWEIDRGHDPEVIGAAARLVLPPLVLLPILERLMTPASVDEPLHSLLIRLEPLADGLLLAIEVPRGTGELVEPDCLAAIATRLARACDGSIALVETPAGGLSYEATLPFSHARNAFAQGRNAEQHRSTTTMEVIQ